MKTKKISSSGLEIGTLDDKAAQRIKVYEFDNESGCYKEKLANLTEGQSYMVVELENMQKDMKELEELDLYNPFIEEEMYYTVFIKFKSGINIREVIDCDTAKDLFKLYYFIGNKNIEYIEYWINGVKINVIEIQKMKMWEYKKCERVKL